MMFWWLALPFVFSLTHCKIPFRRLRGTEDCAFPSSGFSGLLGLVFVFFGLCTYLWDLAVGCRAS